MKIIRIEERWTTENIHSMARYDCYYATCQDCGGTFRLASRMERFLHWFECWAWRKISGKMTNIRSTVASIISNLEKRLKK